MARSSERTSFGAKRAHQLGRETLHLGVGQGRKLVGEKLRRGQQIAQIVIDLGDGEAEGGEPALLMQHRHQVALHVRQFALGNADLVAALARHDDPRRTLGIFVEADQARRQPAHRAHEEIMHGEIDEARGQHRDDQRDHHDVAGEAVHRLPQRQLVGDDLHELGGADAGPDDPDGLVAGLQHHPERAGDRLPRRHVAQVDVVLDGGGQIVAGEQATLLAHLDGDGARIDAFQDLARERIGDHAERRRIEHQRCRVGCGTPAVRPGNQS